MNTQLQEAFKNINLYYKNEFYQDDYENFTSAELEDINNIPLAYTQDETENYDIQVAVNLTEYTLTTKVGDVVTEYLQYNSLKELNETLLINMSFSDLVCEPLYLCNILEEKMLDNVKENQTPEFKNPLISALSGMTENAKRYLENGAPLTINHAEYIGRLTEVQPLTDGYVCGIYHFPGGETIGGPRIQIPATIEIKETAPLSMTDRLASATAKAEAENGFPDQKEILKDKEASR